MNVRARIRLNATPMASSRGASSDESAIGKAMSAPAANLDQSIPRSAAPNRPPPALLQRVPMFAQLDGAILDHLRAISVVADVDDGSELCREGDRAESLQILLEGMVTLSADGPNGRTAVVEVVKPVRHLVLATVLAALPYAMTATAIAPSRMLVIDADGLHALLREDAALANSLMRAQALDFGAMVREVCDLKLRTAAQRLGCYLLELSQEQPAWGAQLRLPIGKQLLAARIGCRHENLSRAFASLREFGVETHGKRVILHDIPSLQEFTFPAGPAAPEPA